MKKKFLIILIASLVISCKEVSFKESQPQGKKVLKEVPRKLEGRYLPYEEDMEDDTLVITSSGYRINHHNDGETDSLRDEAFLSDSLVLKYFKGYYFVSMYDRPQWFLRIIQVQGNGDIHLLHLENDPQQFNDHLKRLSTEVSIDSTTYDGKMIYQIDPSPNELVGLIKKGFFNRTKWRRIR